MHNAMPSSIERELRSADRRQPWSASSQTYAPVSVLQERLADGWKIDPIVGFEEYWYGSGRRVTVYHFELTNDRQTVSMPVLGNPIVRRLLSQRSRRVVLLNVDDVSSFEAGVVEAQHTAPATGRNDPVWLE